ASSTTYPLYDPRVAYSGAGWATTTGVSTLGGVSQHYTTGSAGTLSFTPIAAFDTIKIYYSTTLTNGTFTTNIDGGASLGTTNANAAQALLSVTYSVAKGIHTINIVAGNDGKHDIQGIITQDSTIPAI